MNTVLIWLLVSLPSPELPTVVVSRFLDQAACVAVHKQLEDKPHRLKCVPAKVFIGKEHT